MYRLYVNMQKKEDGIQFTSLDSKEENAKTILSSGFVLFNYQ